MRQRILRVDPAFFAHRGPCFDLWHEGMPWAVRLRSEPRACAQRADPRAAELPLDWLLEGGELFAGLRWEAGAELIFEEDGDGALRVSGDLRA